MVATRKSGKKEDIVPFNTDKTSGVLIQNQFCRAIYFVGGAKIDELFFKKEDPFSVVNSWVEQKRAHYINNFK